MSKGSIILGDVSGKLGDIVLYRTAGAQVARLRVRHPRNPRSTRQMVQRVFQATCLRAYSMLKDICDHSFEDKLGKRENFGQFMKENRAMMTEKLNGYASGWKLLAGYNQRNQRKMLVNDFIIANGTLPKLNYRSNGAAEDMFMTDIKYTNYDFTYKDLCNAIGANKGDELTYVQLDINTLNGSINNVQFARIILEPSGGDMNVPFVNSETNQVNEPNVMNKGKVSLYPYNLGLRFRINRGSMCGAFILSRFENGIWKRSFAPLYSLYDITHPSTLGDAVKSWWQTPSKGKYLNKAERQLYIDN